MSAPHVKRDETVVVIAGADKGRRGRVLEVDAKKQRVLVEGVNTRKKHRRRGQDNPRGGIEERDCPIHISNVMKAEVYDRRGGQSAEAETEPAPQEQGE